MSNLKKIFLLLLSIFYWYISVTNIIAMINKRFRWIQRSFAVALPEKRFSREKPAIPRDFPARFERLSYKLGIYLCGTNDGPCDGRCRAILIEMRPVISGYLAHTVMLATRCIRPPWRRQRLIWRGMRSSTMVHFHPLRPVYRRRSTSTKSYGGLHDYRELISQGF